MRVSDTHQLTIPNINFGITADINVDVNSFFFKIKINNKALPKNAKKIHFLNMLVFDCFMDRSKAINHNEKGN